MPATAMRQTMYTMKAHPTVYNGRQYRSRLEARWAAFFDALGWRHDYEPIDLDGWSPDFIIFNRVLVEVKPITTPDQSIIDKIGAHHTKDAGILLVGLAPFKGAKENASCTSIGWCTHPHATIPNFGEAGMFSRSGRYDFSHSQDFTGLLYLGSCFSPEAVPYEKVSRLWAEASNKVQWKKV